MIDIAITVRNLKTDQIVTLVYRLPEGTVFNTGRIIEYEERLNDTEYEVIKQEVRNT